MSHGGVKLCTTDYSRTSGVSEIMSRGWASAMQVQLDHGHKAQIHKQILLKLFLSNLNQKIFLADISNASMHCAHTSVLLCYPQAVLYYVHENTCFLTKEGAALIDRVMLCQPCTAACYVD